MRRWSPYAGIVACSLLVGCQSDRGVLLSDAACRALAEVEADRARDVSDPAAVRKLVEVLPEELRDEAALFYHPLGGSVEGLDTSGTNAEKAGRTLEASLERCPAAP